MVFKNGEMIELRPAVQFISYVFPEEVKQHFTMLEGGKSNVDGVIIKDKFHIFHSLHLHKEKIRQFQKQQPAKDMFVRPEKPELYKFADTARPGPPDGFKYKHALQQRENWQPVFLNKDGKDWFKSDVNPDMISWVIQWGSIENLIRGIGVLLWNPDNETVKGLYYPDIN